MNRNGTNFVDIESLCARRLWTLERNKFCYSCNRQLKIAGQTFDTHGLWSLPENSSTWEHHLNNKATQHRLSTHVTEVKEQYKHQGETHTASMIASLILSLFWVSPSHYFTPGHKDLHRKFHPWRLYGLLAIEWDRNQDSQIGISVAKTPFIATKRVQGNV